MEKFTLSIIVPVYNGARYLEQTICSILSQPYKDFELILLNDGSTDASLDICKKYEGENVIVESHENMGVSKTRNRGIDMARGKIIIFSDQDDVMKADFYTEEMQDKILEMFSKDIDLILPGRWMGNDTLKRGHFVSIEKQKSGIFPGHEDVISWFLPNVFNANIYSRRLFFDAEGHPTHVRFFNLPLDVETIFRHITQYAANNILFSDEFSFSVRRNSKTSVSSTWDWLKVYPVKCMAYYHLISWHRRLFPNDKDAICGCEKHFLEQVTNMIIENCHADTNLNKLRDDMMHQTYYNDMQMLISCYPNEAEKISLFMDNPYAFQKKIRISMWRKMIRKRWAVLERLNNLMHNVLKSDEILPIKSL